MRRAKPILLVVGICIALLGLESLPLPRANPKALTSVFEGLATTGAFTRQGIVLILVGVGCVALAAVLPSDRD